MDETPVTTGGSSPWRRRGTRRALLGSGAGLAAAAAAAAVVGLGMRAKTGPTPAAAPGPDGELAPTPPAERRLIEDPRRRTAHLLRRAAFGGTLAQIDEFAALGREEAADRLLGFAAVDNSPLDARIAAAGFNLANPAPGARLLAGMQRWWLTRMCYTARPLEERMTLLWHGLLTSQVSKVGLQRARAMVAQNELFRRHALPVYSDLLREVSRDPAMLFYLDTIESTREHPNENYARELMELFSMGPGHYTEEDVRESARAFTGWRVTLPRVPALDGSALSEREKQELRDRAWAEWEPQFFVAARQHDGGSKSFLGQTGNFTGDDIVRIIMEQPATGRFICRRLFTEFANFEPAEATIDRLAATWDASKQDVRAVVREILTSDEFYSEESYRAIVRSPVEFVAGAVRALEIETSFENITESARGMDQVLFEPPSVAGWPGGAAWLSSATFFGRMNFLDAFLFPRGRPLPLPALAPFSAPEALVDAALDRLVDGNVPSHSREALYAHARGISRAEDRAAVVAYLVLASPEYQLI